MPLEYQEDRSPKLSRHWEVAKNASGGPIPPYSVVKVLCYQDGYYLIGVPDADDVITGLAFTNGLTILADSFGSITFAGPPNWVQYETEGSGSGYTGAPGCSDIWGPVAGSFAIHPEHTGFRVVSGPLSLDPDKTPDPVDGDPTGGSTDSPFGNVVLVMPEYNTLAFPADEEGSGSDSSGPDCSADSGQGKSVTLRTKSCDDNGNPCTQDLTLSFQSDIRWCLAQPDCSGYAAGGDTGPLGFGGSGSNYFAIDYFSTGWYDPEYVG